jgi:phosphoribosylformylglycinamidine cyclo-ligase
MKKNVSKKGSTAYAAAGVDIDAKMGGIAAIKKMVKSTAVPGVLSEIGLFGGMFASPGRGTVLVASADGVGTKLKVANLAGRHDTVGQCLVNHCVNDILVQGAKPLFFLDYVGTSRFQGDVFRQIVDGLCKACRENHCALLGGETAELPGLYPVGEYDLVGTIVGAVKRRDVVTGRGMQVGDVVIGIGSSGLQTNGYSLARKIVFDEARLKITDKVPGMKVSVADALLAVHDSYLDPITRLMNRVKIQGMSHITGGGFYDNVHRMLPEGMCAVIDRAAWDVPPLFQFLGERGCVDRDEMYRVFNMGVGFVAIVRRRDAGEALAILQDWKRPAFVIGAIEAGKRSARLIN